MKQNLKANTLEKSTGASMSKVMATFKFTTGIVATCGYDGEQIPELQGMYSKELHEKIKKRSDENTRWNGFN